MSSSCAWRAKLPTLAPIFALGGALLVAAHGVCAAKPYPAGAGASAPADRQAFPAYFVAAREGRSLARLRNIGWPIGAKSEQRSSSEADAAWSEAAAGYPAFWQTPGAAGSETPSSSRGTISAPAGSGMMTLAFGPGFPIALPPGGGSGAPPYPPSAFGPGLGVSGEQKGAPPSPVVELPNENYYIPSLGLQVRAAVGRVSEQLVVPGLAVVSVAPDSPASRAGLRALEAEPNRSREGALTLVAVVTGIFFPPALYIWALSMNDENRIGKACDLIIGVDGTRVAHVLDLDEELHKVKPSDVVYLNVLRNGKRAQVPLYLVATSGSSAGKAAAGSKPPAAAPPAAPGKAAQQ